MCLALLRLLARGELAEADVQAFEQLFGMGAAQQYGALQMGGGDLFFREKEVF